MFFVGLLVLVAIWLLLCLAPRPGRCRSCGKSVSPPEVLVPCQKKGMLCPACWTIFENSAPPAPVLTLPNFAGWLLLPTLAIVCEPFLIISEPMELSRLLGDSRTAHRHQLEQTLRTLWIISIPVAVAVASLAVAFLRKKRSVPGLMAVALPLLAVYDGIVTFIVLRASGAEVEWFNPPKFWLRLLVAMIWSAYFLRSRRVAATFDR